MKGALKYFSNGTKTLAEPLYVKEVKAECDGRYLEEVRRSVDPLPSITSPILISVIKDEIDRLPDFLRHHRQIGVERFCFIDNASSDGSPEYLSLQPDVDLFACHRRFGSNAKQGWINQAMRLYGLDRWFLVLDADEQLIFHGVETRSIGDLAVELQRRGHRRVRGFLLDMYADGPLLESTYVPGEPLIASYPLYDRQGYIERRYIELISVKGGPRRRCFSATDKAFNPELTKYPLFRLLEGEWMVNPHHIWPYDDNFLPERYLAILHFKFLPNFGEKVRAAVADQRYLESSKEYECYADTLRNDPKVAFSSPFSSRYESSSKLVTEGLLSPVGWRHAPGPADIMLTAARRHHAHRLHTCLPVILKQDAPAAPGNAHPSVNTRNREKAPMVNVNNWWNNQMDGSRIDVTVRQMAHIDGKKTNVRFDLDIYGGEAHIELRPQPESDLFGGNMPRSPEGAIIDVLRFALRTPGPEILAQIPGEKDRFIIRQLILLMPSIARSIQSQIIMPAAEASELWHAISRCAYETY